MNEITFLAAYGDETKTIRISRPSGANGTFSIQRIVSPNTFYHIGAVINYTNGWTPVSQKDDFTMDDKQAILDRMVEAGMFEPGDKVNL